MRDPLELPLAWHAAFVRRWHTHEAFAAAGDSVGAQVARVAALALELWPDDAALLRWVVLHTAAEAVLGDPPETARLRFPDIERAWSEARREVNAAAGIVPPADAVPQERAAFCDLLDLVIWMRRQRPDMAEADEWRAAVRHLQERSHALGVAARVAWWLR